MNDALAVIVSDDSLRSDNDGKDGDGILMEVVGIIRCIFLHGCLKLLLRIFQVTGIHLNTLNLLPLIIGVHLLTIMIS